MNADIQCILKSEVLRFLLTVILKQKKQLIKTKGTWNLWYRLRLGVEMVRCAKGPLWVLPCARPCSLSVCDRRRQRKAVSHNNDPNPDHAVTSVDAAGHWGHLPWRGVWPCGWFAALGGCARSEEAFWHFRWVRGVLRCPSDTIGPNAVTLCRWPWADLGGFSKRYEAFGESLHV